MTEQSPESDGTAFGEVQCHCSDPEDGVPDVGVSLGLGCGKALWIGELLTKDGATCGMVMHDGTQRIVAPLADGTDWQEAADILRHHVGPALAAARQALSATARPASDGEGEQGRDDALIGRLTSNIETQRVLIEQTAIGSLEREAARLAYAVMMDARRVILAITPDRFGEGYRAGVEASDKAPDEDWLADVIDDSVDMDWTGRVGARAIIAAWGRRHD